MNEQKEESRIEDSDTQLLRDQLVDVGMLRYAIRKGVKSIAIECEGGARINVPLKIIPSVSSCLESHLSIIQSGILEVLE